MPEYSNSKLKTFEQCPLQFRFRYLDRIPTDVESVEAFTGKRVHETLEWLHGGVRDGSLPSLAAVREHYAESWDRQWHPLVRVVKAGTEPADYRRRGQGCLEKYYEGGAPFTSDRTIALEAEVRFVLGDDDDLLVRGYIDRVARGAGGELVIHDYKTTSFMPRREELLADLQLVVYHLGARERWPGSHDIHLVWHFLTFGRRVRVRFGETIDGRRRELERRIRAAEAAIAAGGFEGRTSRLCDWCAYRVICPAQGGDRSRAGELVLADRPSGRRSRRSGSAETSSALAGAGSRHHTTSSVTIDSGDQLNLFRPQGGSSG